MFVANSFAVGLPLVLLTLIAWVSLSAALAHVGDARGSHAWLLVSVGLGSTVHPDSSPIMWLREQTGILAQQYQVHNTSFWPLLRRLCHHNLPNGDTGCASLGSWLLSARHWPWLLCASICRRHCVRAQQFVLCIGWQCPVGDCCGGWARVLAVRADLGLVSPTGYPTPTGSHSWRV